MNSTLMGYQWDIRDLHSLISIALLLMAVIAVCTHLLEVNDETDDASNVLFPFLLH